MEQEGYEEDGPSRCNSCCGVLLTIISWILVIFTIPFSLCYCIKIVTEYERAVIFRLGRVMDGRPKGPGLFFILPCIDNIVIIDLRMKTYDIPPQEILTKDSVTVTVDAVVFFQISDPKLAVVSVENADQATHLLAQTTLRNCLGTRSLSDLLQQREEVSQEIKIILDSPTDAWGVKVQRVEIKDVSLPRELQRSMAAEAESSREARAKVIAAEGEKNASRALKEAADVIIESPAALQLRYLQTLTTISAENNSTIIFPLPIDIMQSLLPKN